MVKAAKVAGGRVLELGQVLVVVVVVSRTRQLGQVLEVEQECHQEFEFPVRRAGLEWRVRCVRELSLAKFSRRDVQEAMHDEARIFRVSRIQSDNSAVPFGACQVQPLCAVSRPTCGAADRCCHLREMPGTSNPSILSMVSGLQLPLFDKDGYLANP